MCDTKMSHAWHASISQRWMKELIPIFWQIKDMVIDYTLEPFQVPDLHPRSQKHHPKSGRVSDGWPDISLLMLELQRSVIYKYLCLMWDKSHGVVKITLWMTSLELGMSSMDQEGSWLSSIRNIPDPVIVWVTYKCCVLNNMFFFG